MMFTKIEEVCGKFAPELERAQIKRDNLGFRSRSFHMGSMQHSSFTYLNMPFRHMYG